MRSASEAAFRCPVRRLARISKARTFVYLFTLTPRYSEDMPNTSIAGAFHGADVPFVFGYPVELTTASERNLSSTMGCYWRSFLWHGDPSKEACHDSKWPLFKSAGNPYME